MLRPSATIGSPPAVNYQVVTLLRSNSVTKTSQCSASFYAVAHHRTPACPNALVFIDSTPIRPSGRSALPVIPTPLLGIQSTERPDTGLPQRAARLVPRERSARSAYTAWTATCKRRRSVLAVHYIPTVTDSSASSI